MAEVELTHHAEMQEELEDQFDVIVDGRTVFSKQRSGRFRPRRGANTPAAGLTGR